MSMGVKELRDMLTKVFENTAVKQENNSVTANRQIRLKRQWVQILEVFKVEQSRARYLLSSSVVDYQGEVNGSLTLVTSMVGHSAA
jgi:hypothetical protein